MSHSLKAYNSFGLDASCEKLIQIKSVTDIQEFIRTSSSPFFILGGGSNILLPQHLNKTVLKNEILGKSIIAEYEHEAIVEIGGGENWHALVLWTIEQGLGGLENLSLIPGTVGAAPMQNIGAYGVEIKDVFDSLLAINIATGAEDVFDHERCEFGYRSSVFKHQLKDQYFIAKVRFKLQKTPVLKLDYGVIKSKLDEKKIAKPTIKDVSDVVIEIRNSKLPDPSIIGNAGSFFKNPIIENASFEALKVKFETIPSYPAQEGFRKLSAGWLIEQAGWKGKELGGAACYHNHALILINKNNASSSEIKKLATEIQSSVLEKFNIRLEPEVNYI